ncbi:MAG: D-alanyl-D-alanine carboxypeptidase, partial [Thermoleophilaceae bacterium]
MSRRLLVAVALALLVLAAPARAAAAPAVETARSAIVVDASDGAVMFQKHPDTRGAMASTTKLMTALLTLERARPDEVFTAPAYSAQPAESRINLSKGERMRVEDLLQALLLESANDAAATLAQN